MLLIHPLLRLNLLLCTLLGLDSSAAIQEVELLLMLGLLLLALVSSSIHALDGTEAQASPTTANAVVITNGGHLHGHVNKVILHFESVHLSTHKTASLVHKSLVRSIRLAALGKSLLSLIVIYDGIGGR